MRRRGHDVRESVKVPAALSRVFGLRDLQLSLQELDHRIKICQEVGTSASKKAQELDASGTFPHGNGMQKMSFWHLPCFAISGMVSPLADAWVTCLV